jgi:hypothetical protein
VRVVPGAEVPPLVLVCAGVPVEVPVGVLVDFDVVLCVLVVALVWATAGALVAETVFVCEPHPPSAAPPERPSRRAEATASEVRFIASMVFADRVAPPRLGWSAIEPAARLAGASGEQSRGRPCLVISNC